MNKKVTNDKSENKPHMKQMKVFLSHPEHAVVTMAANMKGLNVGDYMKQVVIAQAKKDAREMNKIIDSI
ncbi:hypothetical protein CA11_20020 [Gimesia maris]|uniref:hypothetical protein n=1 Tax=Gimesia maris TaxID=122 RepID=UPI001187EA82|nr:hypothetical protein [Gimesia maris]QDU14198.1 hypothetical protein CA11_20020 [Gimesia maris]